MLASWLQELSQSVFDPSERRFPRAPAQLPLVCAAGQAVAGAVRTELSLETAQQMGEPLPSIFPCTVVPREGPEVEGQMK